MKRLTIVLVLIAACEPGVTMPVTVHAPDQVPQVFADGDPVLGEALFEQECSSCHVSVTGTELAFASASDDTTVSRRALPHVDSATAANIAAYGATLSHPDPLDRNAPFMQAGIPLTSDAAFRAAVSVNGMTGLDEILDQGTWQDWRDIDRRAVQIVPRLPQITDESGIEEWIPNQPLQQVVLDYVSQNKTVAQHIDVYRANPTKGNLGKLSKAINKGSEEAYNCRLDNSTSSPFSSRDCYDARLSGMGFLLTHHLEQGLDFADLTDDMKRHIWDVGFVFRSLATTQQVNPEPDLNPIQANLATVRNSWFAWQWMGFTLDMIESQSPEYLILVTSPDHLNIPFHGTFVGLKNMFDLTDWSNAPRHHAIIQHMVKWGTDASLMERVIEVYFAELVRRQAIAGWGGSTENCKIRNVGPLYDSNKRYLERTQEQEENVHAIVDDYRFNTLECTS